VYLVYYYLQLYQGVLYLQLQVYCTWPTGVDVPGVPGVQVDTGYTMVYKRAVVYVVQFLVIHSTSLKQFLVHYTGTSIDIFHAYFTHIG
jgi:hypothetical protein